MGTFSTTEKFVAKCRAKYGERYDYCYARYVSNKVQVEIKCNHCGKAFRQTPSNHLSNRGCPNCSIEKQRKHTSDFLELAREIHGDLYDYSESVYVNAKTKVRILCKKCDEHFYQLPRGHIYERSGCPHCKNSHGEHRVKSILSFLGVKFLSQHMFSDCKNKKRLKFDFFLPDHNTCIEFDGKQHVDKSSKFWNKQNEINDRIKDEYCIRNGILLKRISFLEVDIIEGIVKKILGI